MASMYTLPVLQENIEQWYRKTTMRSIATVSRFPALFCIPHHFIMFVAKVYALTLVPQLLYTLAMERHSEASTQFYFSSIPSTLLVTLPLATREFLVSGTFIVNLFVHISLCLRLTLQFKPTIIPIDAS